MSKRRIVITGIGCVTPLGNDVPTFWKNLLAGKSGMGPISHFEAESMATNFAAEVKNFEPAEHKTDQNDLEYTPRNCHFATRAGLEAWGQSGLDDWSGLDRDRVGVYLGAGEGPQDLDVFMNTVAHAYRSENRKIDDTIWYHEAARGLNVWRELEQEPNTVGNHLACTLGARGPVYNCLTACAASTQAIESMSTQLVCRPS